MKNILVSFKKNDSHVLFMCSTWEQVYRWTFPPDIEDVFITDFSVRGKAYAERKAYANELVLCIQHVLSSASLSWRDFYIIQKELEFIAKKYGYIREWKNEGII